VDKIVINGYNIPQGYIRIALCKAIAYLEKRPNTKRSKLISVMQRFVHRAAAVRMLAPSHGAVGSLWTRTRHGPGDITFTMVPGAEVLARRIKKERIAWYNDLVKNRELRKKRRSAAARSYIKRHGIQPGDLVTVYEEDPVLGMFLEVSKTGRLRVRLPNGESQGCESDYLADHCHVRKVPDGEYLRGTFKRRKT
jgi:hypothetical protein